jgi:hypothetical protein
MPMCGTDAMNSPRWMFTADALWLTRGDGNGVRLAYSDYNPASHLPPALPQYRMDSDDVLFPLETGLRAQLTWKINDNKFIEGTYWGLQQWSMSDTIYSDPDHFTVLAYSPWLQLSSLMGGLDDYVSYTYKSSVHNAEVNERIRFDLYSPYWGASWLWGFRYFHLADDFTLTGSDIYNGHFEDLNYQTTNDVVAMQIGLQCVRGWERFQLSTELKVGLGANFYTQHGTDTAGGANGVPAGFTPWDGSNNGTGLSAIFELSILARYCVIEKRLFLRAGYQLYCVTGLATGPRQLANFDNGGTVALDGFSLGIEGAW